MAKIKRLPLQVANQIAAGEVVERPSSVVKELVENALDADARRITVEVAQGGRWLRIVDDGEGMDEADAVAAFDRFATSKLRDADELWNLTTMGFRGEALASIASIARVECLTRARGTDRGTKVLIAGGSDPIVKPAGCPEGTAITVEDLFFNTPARLKFLRAAQTEQGHVHDTVLGLALAHPQVDFRLVLNQREVLSTVGAKTLRDVVAALFGAAAAEGMVDVEHGSGGSMVRGLVARPDRVRGDRSRQFFFVNRRWVRHPLLAKAVEEAYQGHMPAGSHPAYVLFVELDPAAVDINVHPQKREIRLGRTQQVYLLLVDAVRMAFAQSWTEADYAPMPEPSQAYTYEPPPRPTAGEAAAAMSLYAPAPRSLALPGFARETLAETWQPEGVPGLPSESACGQTFGTPGLPRELQSLVVIGQLHLTYIMCQHPDGLFLIDQHNSHERWLYEQLTPAAVVSQELLMPLVLGLSTAEAAAAAEFGDRLKTLGFGFAPFDGEDPKERRDVERWILRAIPALLPLPEAETTLRELLSRAEAVGVVVRQPDDDPLRRTIACHAAVRAGDVLSPPQMQQIIDRLRETRHPLTCPHGRPTGIMISMKELARRCLRL